MLKKFIILAYLSAPLKLHLTNISGINLFTVVFTLTVTVFAGMIGGLLGIRLQKRGFEARR